MPRKKLKDLNDAKARLLKSGFGVVKGHKYTAAEEKKFRLVEVERERLAKAEKAPAPSYVKRKLKPPAKPLEKSLRAALDKWGGRGGKIAAFHSEYYTARAAKALTELKANPRAHYEKSSIRKKLKFYSLKNGRYAIERDGVVDHKTYKWASVERLQRKQNRAIKIEKIAGKIGASAQDVELIIKKIKAEETKTVRRFKKTKKFKNMKSGKRRKVTISRRVNAVFGAMTDLLEIYGSPKALRENAGIAQWKKVNGKWSIKEGHRWISKEGPDYWEENKRIRKSTGKGKRK